MNLNEYSLFFLFLIPAGFLIAALRQRTDPKQRRALGLLSLLTLIAVAPFVLFPETDNTDAATIAELLPQTGRTDIAANKPIFLEVYSDY